MKKIIVLLFTIIFLITFCSCEFSLEDLLSKPTVGKTEEIITQEPTKENPTYEKTPDSTNGSTADKTPVVTPTVDNNQNYKFKINEPDFSTRKINNIDEITMEDFFNLGNRIDVKIYISKSELNKLQDDFNTGLKSEIYRLANKVVISLTNNGKVFKWEYENVGIRQKGNTSRREIYDGAGNLNKNHYKLSFDETFNDPEMYDNNFIFKYGNEDYKNRDFLGMSGLDFKWDKNYDYTHIREIYSNYLYRACGIMAQNSGLSMLSLVETDRSNRETSMGLCTVYEPATKSFIKRSLQSGNNYINMSDWDTEKSGTYGVAEAKYGDLYKCLWGANLSKDSISGNKIGISNTSGSYIPVYDRKTNKDVSYNDYLLRNAVNGISSGNYKTISEYVDLEYLAISEAVGYYVGNPDSMRYNVNNFMIYMRRTDGKMIFIPIDSDRCFGITKDWNPRDGHMFVEPLDRTDSNRNHTISLLLDTILSTGSNDAKKIYLEYIERIGKSAWLTNDCFNTYYEMAKKSYSGQYFSLTDESTNYSFNKYITNKLNVVFKNNNTNNNTNNTNESDVYVVSTINDWSANNDKYKMTKLDEYTYTITLTVTKTEADGNYIKFKFNNGYDYSKVDWTIDQNTGKLLLQKGSSYKYYGVYVGDLLTITINTNTLDVNIKKN